MEAFDLKKALAGEPVKLRNGSKAYIKYRADDNPEITQKRDLVCPLVGYWIKDGYMYDIKWSLKGEAHFAVNNSPYSIESMWQEPRPRVLLDLPAPLKEPQEGMYVIDSSFEIYKSDFKEGHRYSTKAFAQGRYFATKEDAQEWLDAMRNARR